jgi:hypothetical protein
MWKYTVLATEEVMRISEALLCESETFDGQTCVQEHIIVLDLVIREQRQAR